MCLLTLLCHDYSGYSLILVSFLLLGSTLIPMFSDLPDFFTITQILDFQIIRIRILFSLLILLYLIWLISGYSVFDRFWISLLNSIDFECSVFDRFSDFHFGVARFRCQDLSFPSSSLLDSLSSDVSSPYSSLSRLLWVLFDPD